MNVTPERPLALVGLSGTGKSTIGPLLAEVLGATHLDLDRSIETASGMSVAEIFADLGEEGFRQIETKELGDALARMERPLVISTGGGVVTTARGRELLKRQAQVLWLDAPPETLVARLAESSEAEPRPLLAASTAPGAGVPDGPEIALRRLADQRQGWYAEVADLKVDVDGSTPEQVVSEILENLR